MITVANESVTIHTKTTIFEHFGAKGIWVELTLTLRTYHLLNTLKRRRLIYIHIFLS